MRLFLIDANALGYAHSAAHFRLSHNGLKTGGFYGFAKNLLSLGADHPDAGIALIWDGSSKARKAFFPEYKAQRGKTEASISLREAWAQQAPHILALAHDLGFVNLLHAGQEADDSAAWLSGALANREGLEAVLATSDTDWLQLVSANIRWNDLLRGKDIGLDNFTSATGYATPSAFIQGKALIGDSSDNIPGVAGIGPKTALKIIQEHGGAQAFFNSQPAHGAKPLSAAVSAAKSPANQELFARNWKLMELDPAKSERPFPTAPDEPTSAESLFERFAIKSLLEPLSAERARAAARLPSHEFLRSLCPEAPAEKSHPAP